jgi:hypothetical protein
MLMDLKADLQVFALDGTVLIKTEAPILQSESLVKKIEEIAKTVPGVKETRIDVMPSGAESLG